ncbi:MAG: alpha-glucosidase, partial [Oscillospiraceae bacterium]|nr:alpha-glucosidase [Oscillospiraceae bacterium]
MIKKYLFGKPFDTEAVVKNIESSSCPLPYFETLNGTGLKFTIKIQKDDAVYGLGEAMRGINKKGYIYNSFCADDPNHTEATHSLYGAHNFIVVKTADKLFGAFFDTPAVVTFDVCYSKFD